MADFLMTSVAVLEEAELSCTVIADADTGESIPPQAPLHVFVPASNAY